jgi:hypothetical protein
MKINVMAFALTNGIILGLAVLLVTLWYVIMGHAGATLVKIHNVFLGYNITVGGAFIGLLWGAVIGFLGGALFACLYNWLLGAFTKQAKA